MVRVRIKVLGSGREVGRAAIAIREERVPKYLLLDYGVNFNEKDEPQLPLHVRPNELSGIVVTHAHLDHIGATPLFYTTSKLPLVTTTLTKELSRIMIRDFLKISGYYLPFEETDLNTMLDNVIDVRYGEVVDVGSYSVQLINAGHIPGSAMVYIRTPNASILYTGDVNTIDTRLVSKPHLNGIEADILIIEGTYGNSIHPPRNVIENEFIEAIKEVIENGGNVLIPSFSLGRSQEILSLLYERMPWAHVYYDGMVRVINNIVLSYPEFLNRYDLLAKAVTTFKLVRGSSDRKKIVKRKGNIIVTSAGMLKGGPAVYYAKKLMDDPNNAVFLVSYQGPSTPGRRVLEDGILEENGELIKARLQWFDFSSHAGMDGLLWIIRNIKNLKKVVVVHSEEETGNEFINFIKDNIGIDDITFPRNGDEIVVDL